MTSNNPGGRTEPENDTITGISALLAEVRERRFKAACRAGQFWGNQHIPIGLPDSPPQSQLRDSLKLRSSFVNRRNGFGTQVFQMWTNWTRGVPRRIK